MRTSGPDSDSFRQIFFYFIDLVFGAPVKKLYFECTMIFYRFCPTSLDKDEFSDDHGIPNSAEDTEKSHWFVSFSLAGVFPLKEWQISFPSNLQTQELHQRNFWSSCNRRCVTLGKLKIEVSQMLIMTKNQQPDLILTPLGNGLTTYNSV